MLSEVLFLYTVWVGLGLLSADCYQVLFVFAVWVGLGFYYLMFYLCLQFGLD